MNGSRRWLLPAAGCRLPRLAADREQTREPAAGSAYTPLSIIALLLFLAACTPSDRPRGELRFWTDRYAVRVSSTPSPPRAREAVRFRVVVSDKESGRPMERAEGQVYASNGQGTNTYGTLAPGPELGTYYTTLRFINAGEWALNMRFRGTPTDSIETAAPDGWRQIVGAAAQ